MLFERIEGLGFFEVVGVDFVGFIKYCKFLWVEGKVYLVFYVCSLMRVLYLEILLNLEIIIFMVSLKWFIVRWGWFLKIFLDNGRIFVGVVKLIKEI